MSSRFRKVLAQSSDKGDIIWQHDRTGLRVAAFRLNLPSPVPFDPAVVKPQLLDRLPALYHACPLRISKLSG
jgi:hypothetical protein